VGPPGFEPGSIAPEATSLDQASRQPLHCLVRLYVDLEVTKISIPQTFRVKSLEVSVYK
jgi:hypothetical protein